MASSLTTYLVILFSVACATSDEIDIEMNSGSVLKFLRAMTNQTKGGDTLNLPANASSIRENITDTFSCENRTYGYYADVDNECQVFHVCLPSQTPSGRNVTYRWSFICPKETIFNQEVLVCTRPIDSIPCEESPMYYYLNMEIGKVSNDTKEQTNDPNKMEGTTLPPRQNKIKKNQNRRPVQKKQDIVVQNLLQRVVDEEMPKIEEMEIENGPFQEMEEEIVPVLVDVANENDPNADDVEARFALADIDEGRQFEGRSMNYNGRKTKRGGFRFKADV